MTMLALNIDEAWQAIAADAERRMNERVEATRPNQMIDQKGNTRWYIALTEPGRENTAAAGLVGRRNILGDDNFACYLPTIVKSVWSKARKRCRVNRPMFPGYLFVQLRFGNEPWDYVRAVPGVRDFLKTSGSPVTVPALAIDKIKLKEGEQSLPHKERAAYWKGMEVEVMKGPFATFLGPIERMSGHDRVKVMLNIFGRGVEVDLHESEIRFTEASA